ncbi:branched-chain amino acid aminotransferase [Spongiactinospora gelatinilytica]|uniref:Branched-chain amino acid aminotransferase n=1 Tax=Spongiactinospora gelatinilytica TaxID=2666298 RepID=A0A2W2F2K1_9ACTN|nr:aminotransferase class IV [Spongiactinospora gelatinilytica]PZG29323.1 branched-chain amino acid aminotransferase [Spongiactinospora gelatinilytica]
MSENVPEAAVAEYKRGFACVDGEFVPAATASVSIFDHSFLYGDGVFETIICRGGRLFALRPHLDRLWASCQYLQITPPYDQEQITAFITELAKRNELSDGYVRVVISRGEGYPVSDPRKALKPKLVISMQGAPAVTRPPGVGVKLAIASTRRTPPICLEPRVKSNNYLNHIVAKLEAIAAGADDAIMLDLEGNVAELPVANIFARHGDTLATPPSNGILAGITRETVLRLVAEGAAGPGLRVVQRVMTAYDLFTAAEVFIVGTGSGVAFVESIDGRRIGDGTMGPATERLMDAYTELLGRDGAEPDLQLTTKEA